MTNRSLRQSFLGLALGITSLALAAQPWEATRQARSWAKQDKDDSFTFYDSANRELHTWTRDGGVTISLPTGKVEGPPDRWVMDPRNNAWVARGALLTQIDRTGRILETLRLPAAVGDVCWDARGFVLSFRTELPYLEKRDFKGALLWSSGVKPGRQEGAAHPNRPVLMDDDGKVLMADGNTLNLVLYDSQTGQRLSEAWLYLPGGTPAPNLEGTKEERGPLALWPGKGVVFAALTTSQVPAPMRNSLQGLVLARLDLGDHRVSFLPTGLDDSHLLVGVLEDQAVFVKPGGGLTLVKVQ